MMKKIWLYREFIGIFTILLSIISCGDSKRAANPFEVTISGKVIDGESKPIVGAIITTNPSSTSLSTDSNGQYTVSIGIEAGIYTITAQKEGYETNSVQIKAVDAKAGQRADIVLRKEIALSVTPILLDFGRTKNSILITIANQGKGVLQWKIIVPSETWLSVNTTEGAVGTEPITVNVTVRREGLRPGSYNTKLVISAEGKSQEIDVLVQAGDSEAPVVSFLSPLNNTTVHDTVNIQIDARDNIGVKQVDFFIDGTLRNSDSTPPFEYKWDTKTENNKSHILSAKAYDNEGNMGESTLTVTVENRRDLAVLDVYVLDMNKNKATNITEGDSVYLALAYNNSHPQNEESWFVYLYLDGEILNQGVSTTSPDQQMAVSWIWKAVAGTHTLTWKLDALNNLEEINEENNEISYSFEVASGALADLVIENFYLTPKDDPGNISTTFRPDQEVSIYVKYRNAGNKVASGWHLELYLDGDFLYEDKDDISLQGGESAEESYTWSVPSQGAHVLELRLDSKNLITESNENNNTYRLNFNITAEQTTPANIYITAFNTSFGGDLITLEDANFDPQNAPIKILESGSIPLISWQGGPVQSVQVVDVLDSESGALYGIDAVSFKDEIPSPVRYGNYSIPGTKVSSPSSLWGNWHVPSPPLEPGVQYLVLLWKMEYMGYLSLSFYYTSTSGKPVKIVERKVDYHQNFLIIQEVLSKKLSPFE